MTLIRRVKSHPESCNFVIPASFRRGSRLVDPRSKRSGMTALFAVPLGTALFAVPFGTVLFGALSLALMLPRAYAKEEIRVVTTTKTFADLVTSVGGDLVRVDYVAPPNQNVHFIQPRPSDILRLTKADLFVHAGLDLELWRYPLAEASGKPELLQGGKRELDLSKGIGLLEIPQGPLSRAEGDIHIYGNPHYWMNPQNGKIMARTLYEKLSEIAPEHREAFETNLKNFLERLDQKIETWKEAMAPYRGTALVTYHASWPYFAEFAGFEIIGFVEPKPGIPPTPRHVSELLRTMREKQAKIIVKEPYFENSTPKKLAKETGAQVLVLAHSVGEVKEATHYLAMFDYNIRVLESALQKR